MNLFHWVQKHCNNLGVVFAENQMHVRTLFQTIIDQIPKGTRSIIIDCKRNWVSSTINENAKLFFAKSKGELIEIIYQLKSFIHSRVSLIVVDHYPYFLRDYIGKDAKAGAINLRAYAAGIAILSNTISSSTLVLISSYPNSQNRNYPLFENVNRYYQVRNFKVEAIINDKFKFNKIDKNHYSLFI